MQRVLAVLAALSIARIAIAAPGDLIDFARDTDPGIDGLNGARALAISPDGANVYVAAPVDDGVSEFAIAPDGTLGFLAFAVEGVDGATGLAAATDVAVSPDGAHVYVAAATDNAIAVFSRAADTGVLSFASAVFDDVPPVNGLANAAGVVVRPDGAYVYAIGLVDDAVVAFSRNAETGALGFVEAELDDDTRALQGPTDLAMSPDGGELYVVCVAEGGDSLLTFATDPATGALTLIDSEVNEVGGVTGLLAASAVVVSPDGRDVYVTGLGSNTLAIFDRSAADGTTTFVTALADGTDGIDGLSAPVSIAITPDGRFVLTAGFLDDGIGLFARDPATGLLTYDGILKDGIAADTLDAASDVTLDPTGRWVLTTAFLDDALTVFAPEPEAAALGAAACAALAFSRRRARTPQSVSR
jgi:6-phosphogluconolactonase (cycloisomerase 2 family)